MPLLKRFIAVPAFLLFLSSSLSFADNSVMLSQTGQKASYAARDDGDLRAGLAWPSPRFTDNGDGTITDSLTGLMWLKDANLSFTLGLDKIDDSGNDLGLFPGTWTQAMGIILDLDSGIYTDHNAGYSDWRLPNILELESVTTAGTSCYSMLNSVGFTGALGAPYAVSTTPAASPTGIWYINLICGRLVYVPSQQSGMHIMAVRGSPGGPGALVRRTGQTISYAAGDDGALQLGVAWPSPRFALKADGTVTDRLTNLIWAQDAGTPAFGGFDAGRKSWSDALAYIDALNAGNYLGHSDWRLPNRKELESLVDFSQYRPALPPGNPFINVMTGNGPDVTADSPYFYWSSTTHFGHTDSAFYLDPFTGEVPFTDKVYAYFVWPVRGDTTVPVPPSPASGITSPQNGTYLPGPMGTYSITGTAGGGVGGIQGVSVSTDGGSTWNTASDTSGNGSWSSWSYSWTPQTPGKYNIKSKAEDSDGNQEMPGPGIGVYAGIYLLNVSDVPANGGSVALSPSGGYYSEGTKVSLTAAPAPKFIFSGWSGALSGTTNPASITMNSVNTVTANFISPDYTLTVYVSPPGTGSVQVSPSGAHKPGDVVSLTAVPADNYLFQGWEGNVADKTSASTTIVMNGNASVTADFVKKRGLALSMTQYGQKVTMSAALTDDSPSGRTVKFMLSADGGNTWTTKAQAVTGADGTCSKMIKLPPAAYKLKASCTAASGKVYESAALDCYIAQVHAESPPPKAVVSDPAPPVSWDPMADATGYEVRIFSGKTELGAAGAGAGSTSVDLPPLVKGKRVSWSVTALLPTGRSIPSATRAITYKENTSLTGLGPGLSGSQVSPSATLSGQYSGPLVGKKVRFMLKNSSGVWSGIGQALTDSSGKAQMPPKTLKSGSYSLKAVFGGDAGENGAETGEMAVIIE